MTIACSPSPSTGALLLGLCTRLPCCPQLLRVFFGVSNMLCYSLSNQGFDDEDEDDDDDEDDKVLTFYFSTLFFHTFSLAFASHHIMLGCCKSVAASTFLLHAWLFK